MAKQSVKTEKAKGSKSKDVVPSLFDWQSPLLDLRKEIDLAFSNVLKGWPRIWDQEPFEAAGLPAAFGQSDLSPKVEMAESDDAYEITAELPGLDEQEVEVSLREGLLTLSGEKKAEREEKKKDTYLSERRYGAFKRSFRIPDDVQSDKITAMMKKGVMTITMPKSAKGKTKARKIAINGG